MTGAELKTIRESLGLTAQWCAENIGGLAHIRSWQRWESGEVPVPDGSNDVADQIAGMDQVANMQASEACRLALEFAKKKGPPEWVDLYRYRTDAELWASKPEMRGLPTTYHAAILARTRANLIEAGFKVAISYADSKAP